MCGQGKTALGNGSTRQPAPTPWLSRAENSLRREWAFPGLDSEPSPPGPPPIRQRELTAQREIQGTQASCWPRSWAYKRTHLLPMSLAIQVWGPQGPCYGRVFEMTLMAGALWCGSVFVSGLEHQVCVWNGAVPTTVDSRGLTQTRAHF